MFRQISLCVLFLAAILAIVGWSLGWFQTAAAKSGEPDTAASQGVVTETTPTNPVDIGEVLHGKPASVPYQALKEPVNRGIVSDPIPIYGAHVGVIDKVDVPSQRDGVLDFIAVEVKPGDAVAADDITYDVKDDKGRIIKQYRRLKEGDVVHKGELVAQVDSRLATAERNSKNAKLKASEADYASADKLQKEAYERYKTQDKLFRGGRDILTSEEEWRGAWVSYQKYIYDASSKQQAIYVAQAELVQADTTLGMYYIKSPIDGKVKQIYKHAGEAIKALEPILQVQNSTRVRIEGMADLQYFQALGSVKQVTIEPTVRMSPVKTFGGHSREITGVAVSKDPKDPSIVSASDDRTVRVWKTNLDGEVAVLRHPSAVRAVACTPPGAEAQLGQHSNLCLAGMADGRGWIWDLDSKDEKALRELEGRHSGAVQCVSFSPDGVYCATGGDDRQIMLWETATGKLLYSIAGHRDKVTYLQFFVTANGELRLASDGNDDTLRVWKLGTKAAEQEYRLDRRQGDEVAQLGISPDGQLVMDDRGSEMRILSLSKDQPRRYVLRNRAKSTNFKTLALFSPDPRLVLTANGVDGQLQLWRLGQNRSYEFRQLQCGDRTSMTSAGFDPHGRFVVAGTKDRRVCLWKMPTEQEISQDLTATVINRDSQVTSAEGQFRFVAEFDNSKDVVVADDIVTMVAYPGK
jgi:WD40 repeat protein